MAQDIYTVDLDLNVLLLITGSINCLSHLQVLPCTKGKCYVKMVFTVNPGKGKHTLERPAELTC